MMTLQFQMTQTGDWKGHCLTAENNLSEHDVKVLRTGAMRLLNELRSQPVLTFSSVVVDLKGVTDFPTSLLIALEELKNFANAHDISFILVTAENLEEFGDCSLPELAPKIALQKKINQSSRILSEKIEHQKSIQMTLENLQAENRRLAESLRTVRQAIHEQSESPHLPEFISNILEKIGITDTHNS